MIMRYTYGILKMSIRFLQAISFQKLAPTWEEIV